MERRLHLFWPLTLIGAGIIWILIELGKLPAANLWALTYVWPVLLIGAGIGLILRPYWRYASALMSALIVGVLFLSVVFAGTLGWNRVPAFSIDGGPFIARTGVAGSGHVITQARDVKGFTSIRVGYPASILITQGTTESLTIEAEDNVVAAISTTVSGGVLIIDHVRDSKIFINPTRPVKITIAVKDLQDVGFDSAGELTIQGFKSDALKVELNGAGTINLNGLQVGKLEANMSGAGTLHALGTADSLDARLDGVGSFDGVGLKSQKATVQLNGLGNADLWVTDALTAQVNGLGSVHYYGNPAVSKSVNGVGTVQHAGDK